MYMKKLLISIAVIVIPVLFVMGLASIVYALDSTSTESISLNININNPLNSEIDTIPAFIEELLRIVLKIGIPIVVIFIIYAGFLFVTATGNAEKLKTAKATLLYTLIGSAILLGAWVIAEAIQGTISQLGA